MIITCKKQVPLHWVLFSVLPTAASNFNAQIIGVAFLFSLKKFIENPAAVTFILSLPGFVSILTAPLASFLSDRIWTRYGRRKPFILVSWPGAILCLTLMPLMPNFWCLLAVFMLLNLSTDLGVTLEPLKQEIIPPHERGRAMGGVTWCANLGYMSFYFFALGRFDDVTTVAGSPFAGETVIYWSGALLLFAMLLLVTLGIKEINQKSALVGQKLSLSTIYRGLLDNELWPIYFMVIGSAVLNAGLGPLNNLLATEQWGYTKQEVGINMVAGGTINLFLIGLLTLFADKLNRMRAYQILICASVIINFSYYCYVDYVLPDRHPTLVEMIVFGETLSIIGILTNMVYFPLVYDFIRRNKMGTYVAGAQMMTRLTNLITLNGVGLFVWGYATLFQAPAGEMTRVVLHGAPPHVAEIRSLLQTEPWTYPGSNAAAPFAAIDVRAWQANGTISDSGRCWEVRLRDASSKALEEKKEKLALEISSLLSQQKAQLDQAVILKQQGKIEAAKQARLAADFNRSTIDQINSEIAATDAALSGRADKFHAEVVKVFGDRLMSDGEQVLGATEHQALVLDQPTAIRPDGLALEKALDQLRRESPGIIDLRPTKRGANAYGISISALLDSGADPVALTRDLLAAVERTTAFDQPGLFGVSTLAASSHIEPALTLNLLVLEDPVDTSTSPVTRAVNSVLGFFGHAPRADHRLTAMARTLRQLDEINQIRVELGPEPKTISVTAVIPSTAAKAPPHADPVSLRMDALLGSAASPDLSLQARAFFDRIEAAAATQRITVERPILTSSYAAMKYDYMSGYLWMLLLGLLGIGITFVFARLEAKGFIRKRGIEEEQAS